ncbi:hypothetical protein B0A49_07907 [Cryomyces minteri]|uniref:BAH domain-containing protein n=2 Tax=Cryomyces minteri TaxID=331657 RepID=A0A4U0WPD3_9PEZI|nr:hypothetical protein B0A49_11127 [Cryomyces minteri]TKA65190.1 hypothetical protein B0A49_07907 [Cryomyces minteri]
MAAKKRLSGPKSNVSTWRKAHPMVDGQEIPDANQELTFPDEPHFTIHYPPVESAKSKKRKRTDDPETETERDGFGESANTAYYVKPARLWESLKKYRKLTLTSEKFEIGDVVLVQKDEVQGSKEDIDVQSQWKAKLLEVRARGPEHVFVRVYWLYRPEDIPGGRKPHHGRNELLPSDYMDVIDAQSINGKIRVKKWDEHNDDDVLEEDDFFWRQKYSYAKGFLFPPLRQYCVDKAPASPDEPLVWCDKCEMWLHQSCIIEDATKRAAETKHQNEDLDGSHETLFVKDTHTKPFKRVKGSQNRCKSKDKNGNTTNGFRAEVRIKDAIHGEETEFETESKILVVDLSDDRQWQEDLLCLSCHTKID